MHSSHCACLVEKAPESILRMDCASVSVVRMNVETGACLNHTLVLKSLASGNLFLKCTEFISYTVILVIYTEHTPMPFLKFKCTQCSKPLGICIEINFRSPDTCALPSMN